MQSDIGAERPSAQVLDLVRAWRLPPGEPAVTEGIPRVDREVFTLLEHGLPGAEFHPFRDVWHRGHQPLPSDVSPEHYTTKHQSLIELGSGWTLVAAGAEKPPERPSGNGFPAHVLPHRASLKRSVAEAGSGPELPKTRTRWPRLS
ncbi:hypothetical protein A4R44_00914 [Amycolatopsis sp. M39]|nr:hypothetical protein A4R44_00914 [Amycolatopsis sp. M39]